MNKKILVILIIVLSLSLTACAPKENEQTTGTYPEKKVTLVVPWAVGGITDRVARVFAPLLEKNLGQPVTIVNKEGASGAIGTEFVYEQAEDGYTLLFSAETPANFKILETSKLSFEDFDALKMLVNDTKVIVVPKDSKYNSLEELVKDIRENPGKIKMSYSGPGASGHIQGLLFKELGLDVSMTPYGGGSPAMIATISGEVDFTFGNYATVKDYLEVGDLKALATFTKDKSDIIDIPPITQAIPQSEAYLPLYFPNIVLVKKGTPQAIEEKLIEAIEKALDEPEWEKFIEDESYNRLDDLSKEEIDDYWKKYTSITAWLLYDAGATTIKPSDINIEKFKK